MSRMSGRRGMRLVSRCASMAAGVSPSQPTASSENSPSQARFSMIRPVGLIWR